MRNHEKKTFSVENISSSEDQRGKDRNIFFMIRKKKIADGSNKNTREGEYDCAEVGAPV